jgi:cardiolipin synthase
LINQKKFLGNNIAQDENESDKLKLMNLLLNSNNSIITFKNSYEIYTEGEKFFESLIRNLKKAKQSIHMEFFIWTSDSLGQRIKDILIQKVKEGIEVRLIFDGIGSFGRISYKYKKELKKAGIMFKYFLDMPAPLSLIKINYSNHRKIVVIDGEIAYTGGMNIGVEYITGGSRFDSWKDTQIKLMGESVNILQTIFLVDWYNSGTELLLDKKYFPENSNIKQDTQVQIVTSGADSEWSSIQQMYFTMITNANNEICIETPYFIPDQSTMTALETAALSGIKINILMAGIPDKKISFWAAHTYFDSLIKTGANIYFYKKGFLHSKVLIVDKTMVSIGSCNFDMRSFHLNYEINTLLYDTELADKMTKNFYDNLKNCEKITQEYLDNLGFFKSCRNSATKILSPIM